MTFINEFENKYCKTKISLLKSRLIGFIEIKKRPFTLPVRPV